jgi:hypothetical protein
MYKLNKESHRYSCSCNRILYFIACKYDFLSSNVYLMTLYLTQISETYNAPPIDCVHETVCAKMRCKLVSEVKVNLGKLQVIKERTSHHAKVLLISANARSPAVHTKTRAHTLFIASEILLSCVVHGAVHARGMHPSNGCGVPHSQPGQSPHVLPPAALLAPGRSITSVRKCLRRRVPRYETRSTR